MRIFPGERPAKLKQQRGQAGALSQHSGHPRAGGTWREGWQQWASMSTKQNPAGLRWPLLCSPGGRLLWEGWGVPCVHRSPDSAHGGPSHSRGTWDGSVSWCCYTGPLSLWIRERNFFPPLFKPSFLQGSQGQQRGDKLLKRS